MKKIFFLTLSLCMSSSITCMDIYEAAYQGDLERVQELLTINPELVNDRNQCHATPLHAAASNGQTEVASLLLDYRADVNAPDNLQYTPCMWLHIRAIQKLLRSYYIIKLILMLLVLGKRPHCILLQQGNIQRLNNF